MSSVEKCCPPPSAMPTVPIAAEAGVKPGSFDSGGKASDVARRGGQFHSDAILDGDHAAVRQLADS